MNIADDIRIAVIIPAYNCESTIGEVINSINNQTAKEYIKKIIVVNDGSTDNSLNKIISCKKNSEIPVTIIDKKNEGVSSARNSGIQSVVDENWIALCDSDDLWKNNKIEVQVDLISNNHFIDILGGPFCDKNLRIGLRTITKLYKGTVKDICIQNFPQPSTVLMRKEVFDKIGGFDEKQRYAEDGNFFLKAAAMFNLFYYPELLIEYGRGKRGFGVSGLSSKLYEMYKGNKKNLKEIKELGYIDFPFYCCMRMFYYLKYVRRVVITKVSK